MVGDLDPAPDPVAGAHVQDVPALPEARDEAFVASVGADGERVRDVRAVELDPDRTRVGAEIDGHERVAAGDQVGAIGDDGNVVDAACLARRGDGAPARRKRRQRTDDEAADERQTLRTQELHDASLPGVRPEAAVRVRDGVKLEYYQPP